MSAGNSTNSAIRSLRLFGLFWFASVLATAAPVAFAYTQASVSNPGNPPCWATNTVTTAYPIIGIPWDTSGHHTNYLNASASTGTGLTYTWSQTSGPSTVTFTPNANAVNPTIGNVVAGYYVMHLHVVDSMAATSDVDLDVGAIGIDANGVVINTDAGTTNNTFKIFGPMIALGYNPWCYEDERNITATMLQIANNPYPALVTFNTRGSGTIAYELFGTGTPSIAVAPAGCSLNGNITSSSTSIPVHLAQNCPSLANLPTTPAYLWINGPGGELVKFSSCSAAPCMGDVTLTVAHDGRGIAPYPNAQGVASSIPATSHTTGQIMGEMALVGTSTHFVTDASRPICPAGAPGPPGPVLTSASTVSISGTTATLAAGTWPASVVPGTMIRVAYTFGGGTSDVWWDQVVTVPTTSTLTFTRPFPADADSTTGLSYKITGQYYLDVAVNDVAAPIFGAGNDATYEALAGFMLCQSETLAYAIPTTDITNLYPVHTQSGVTYSWLTGVDSVGGFGSNFYGTGLALQAFGLRSGYAPATTFAYEIDDNWMRSPQFCGGWCAGGQQYNYTGSVIGGVADVLFNPSAVMTIKNLRPWALTGKQTLDAVGATCSNTPGYTLRDFAAQMFKLELVNIFDSNSTLQSTYWNPGMGSAGSGALQQDQTCAHADYSFAINSSAQSFNYDAQITVTNGSAVATGTGFGGGAIPSNVCAVTDSGTITVTNGSASATLVTGTLGTQTNYASLSTTNYRIVIYDTTSSPKKSIFLEFRFTGSAVTLAANWPGASGTFAFVVESGANGVGGLGGGNTSIGPTQALDSSSPFLQHSWACTWNSTTQITLDHPWDTAVDGAAGTYYLSVAGLHSTGLVGFFSQPFQHGMFAKAVSYAANYAPNSTVKSGYSAILGPMTQWFHDTGFDTATLGLQYGTVMEACLPHLTPNASTKMISVHGTSQFPSCDWVGLLGDPDPGDGTTEFPSRVNNSEGFHDVIEYFKYQCGISTAACDAARTFGDQAYGAIWGYPAWTQSGFFSDTHFVSTHGELSNASIGAYKWSGFFWGMGMQHQWPALRVQGLTNPGGVTVSGSIPISGNVTHP